MDEQNDRQNERNPFAQGVDQTNQTNQRPVNRNRKKRKNRKNKGKWNRKGMKKQRDYQNIEELPQHHYQTQDIVDRIEMKDNVMNLLDQIREEHTIEEEMLSELLNRISDDLPPQTSPELVRQIIDSVEEEYLRDSNEGMKSVVREFTQRITNRMTPNQIDRQVLPKVEDQVEDQQQIDSRCKFCGQSYQPLITVCGCTDAPVHYQCLCKWIVRNGDQSCEVCGQQYSDPRIERVSNVTIWSYISQIATKDKQLVFTLATILVMVLLRKLTVVVQLVLILYAGFLIVAHYTGYREQRQRQQTELRFHQWPEPGKYPNDTLVYRRNSGER